MYTLFILDINILYAIARSPRAKELDFAQIDLHRRAFRIKSYIFLVAIAFHYCHIKYTRRVPETGSIRLDISLSLRMQKEYNRADHLKQND